MKSVRKYLLIGFIPLISTVSTFAQKVAVSGKVLDVSNKNPLPYVNVILKKEADSSFVTGAVSNEEGIFVLNNIVKGNYLLSTSLVGYLPVSKKVSVGQLSEVFRPRQN